MYVGLENALDLPQASTLCNQCGVVCPVKIPLPDLQRKLREKQFERALRRGASAPGCGLWAWFAQRPALYGPASKLGVRMLRALADRDGHDPQASARQRLDGRARHAGAGGAHVPRAVSQRATQRSVEPMNAPHGGSARRVPPLSRRAESLGTENAFVVLAEVNALMRAGHGHRLVLHRTAGFPDAAPTSRTRRSPRSASGKHGYTPSAGIDELRAAARERHRSAARPRHRARRRRRRRRREAVHRLCDRVGDRSRRRRRSDLSGPRISDLRVADRGERRGAGADLPARVAQLRVRSRGARGEDRAEDAAPDPQHAAESDRRHPRARDLDAIAEILVRASAGVGVRRRDLLAPRLRRPVRFDRHAGRAARAHDHQRRREQDVGDDRLAHRLRGEPRAGAGVHALDHEYRLVRVADLAMGRRRGDRRPAGRRRRDARRASSSDAT